MSARFCPGSAGFTLVEMVVVIVITALTATLVMQGIGQGLGLFQRVSADQNTLYHELMSRDWIRQTLATAVASSAAGDDFRGSARTISLRTFRPLLGSEGIATGIDWTLGDDGLLEYREGDQQFWVDAGTAILRIEYQDDKAAWHDHWPPDETHRLPQRIRLFGDGDERMDISVLTMRTPFTGADDQAPEDE